MKRQERVTGAHFPKLGIPFSFNLKRNYLYAFIRENNFPNMTLFKITKYAANVIIYESYAFYLKFIFFASSKTHIPLVHFIFPATCYIKIYRIFYLPSTNSKITQSILFHYINFVNKNEPDGNIFNLPSTNSKITLSNFVRLD